MANKLLPYQKEERLEMGIDEAGRGCLFGPVFVAGVILPNNILELCEKSNIVLKDSKKMTKKNRTIARDFIIQNAIDYSIVSKDNNFIDEKNIFATTMIGMHEVVDNIIIKPEKILVDGDHFNYYKDSNDNIIDSECVIKGDDTYMCIAAASILAKTAKDAYIEELVEKYPELNKYSLTHNSGYGTVAHIEAIKKYGITEFHRKTFGICKWGDPGPPTTPSC